MLLVVELCVADQRAVRTATMRQVAMRSAPPIFGQSGTFSYPPTSTPRRNVSTVPGREWVLSGCESHLQRETHPLLRTVLTVRWVETAIEILYTPCSSWLTCRWLT